MRDEDNLEVVQAPPTPPRPQTPPPHNSESDKLAELDKGCGSESDTEVEMSEEGVVASLVESDRTGQVHSSDSEIKPNSNSGLKVEPDGVIMGSNTQTETMINSTSKTSPDQSVVSDSNPINSSDQTATLDEAASD